MDKKVGDCCLLLLDGTDGVIMGKLGAPTPEGIAGSLIKSLTGDSVEIHPCLSKEGDDPLVKGGVRGGGEERCLLGGFDRARGDQSEKAVHQERVHGVGESVDAFDQDRFPMLH
jgi:hypothetical protein